MERVLYFRNIGRLFFVKEVQQADPENMCLPCTVTSVIETGVLRYLDSIRWFVRAFLIFQFVNE